MCLHSCDKRTSVTAIECSSPDPANEEDWLSCLNPSSLEVVTGGLASPPLVAVQPGDRYAHRTRCLYPACSCSAITAGFPASLQLSCVWGMRNAGVVSFCVYPKSVGVSCRFQLERLGYFHVDSESKPGAVVLNCICTLKERVAKQEAAKGSKR
jgi:hypothetical protein